MKTIFLLFSLSILVFGNHLEEKDKYDESQASLLEQSLHEGIIFRDYLSERFTAFSTSVDNYLADEPDSKLYENKSFIHFQSSIEKIQDSQTSNKFDVKIRIKLPKTKKRFRFEFENVDNTNDSSKDARINDVNDNESFAAGIGYVKQLKEYLSFSTGVGVRLKINEFDPYIKAKLRKTFNMPSEWKSDLAQKVYLFNDRGLESTSSYEIYKVFNDTYKFSNYNEFFWKEHDRDDNIYNSFRLYQNVSKKDYLSYVTSVTTNNIDSNLQVKDYQAYVSYRHFFKKWAYYDVIPKFIWQREDDFDIKYGIRINLGMFIGRR